MKRLAIGAAVAGLIAVAAVVVGANALRGQGDGTAEGEYGTLYIDVKPDGNNTKTGFGAIDVCRDTDDLGGPLDVGDSFTIDIVVDDATNPIAGAQWRLNYGPTVLKVTGSNWASWKLGSGLRVEDALPDSDGSFYTASTGSGASGDGVLQGLTLQAVASGQSDLTLSDVQVSVETNPHYPPEVLVDDPTGEVRVVVGGPCPPVTPAAIEPTRTPPRTEALATPTVLAGLERLSQEEAAKPRFEGVVNGIRLYRTGAAVTVQRKWACSDAKPEDVQHPAMSAVAGTPMEIVPTYLPPDAEEVAPTWPPVVCKGVLVYVERGWVTPGRGWFSIYRYEGEQAIDVDASVDRVSAASIGGKAAVLVKPLTPEGFGYSMVIVAEDFGLTVVAADGLPIEETVKIAEGLK
jgi:hypothetical protein